MAAKRYDLDPEDPEYIAEHPPPEVPTAQRFFQIGEHEGKWSEYDDRGVPTKTVKGKKLGKKEKDTVEADYLAHKKKHVQYLKEVEAWEQSKIDAEAALQGKDLLRWAFRQIGENKKDPIEVSNLGELFDLMEWRLLPEELEAVERGAKKVADDDSLELEALRSFIQDKMAECLLQFRLEMSLEDYTVTDLYTPRTWRKKMEGLEDDLGDESISGSPKRGKRNSINKGKKSKSEKSLEPDSPGGKSPREGRRTSSTGTKSNSPRDGTRSPKRNSTSGGSPTGRKSRVKDVEDDEGGSPKSPRTSVRSPREMGKDKSERKKEKKGKADGGRSPREGRSPRSE